MSKFDLVVIGAGSGGIRCARMASRYGAKVAIIEDRYLGGTCVNVGCVPKKLYVYGSSFGDMFEDAKGYGWSATDIVFAWETLRDQKIREINRLNDIYKTILEDSDVHLVIGRGHIIDPHHVRVNDSILNTSRIVIATGGWPSKPKIPGIELAKTSNDIFDLERLPKKILVVGGGYIAIEFAGIFNALGVKTILSYRGPDILKNFDSEIVDNLLIEMEKNGVDIRFNHNLYGLIQHESGQIKLDHSDVDELLVDEVLLAIGRVPNTEGLGLENTSVTTRDNGSIEVFDHFRTCDESIFAIGDVTGTIALTPVALVEGETLARYLFNRESNISVDYSEIPTTIFSQPNIGTIGLSEEKVLELGFEADVYVSEFKPMRLSLSNRNQKNIFKLLVECNTGRVLGLHILASDAGEILQGFAVALKAGATKADFDRTIGIHPTAAEELVTMRHPTRTIGG